MKEKYKEELDGHFIALSNCLADLLLALKKGEDSLLLKNVKELKHLAHLVEHKIITDKVNKIIYDIENYLLNKMADHMLIIEEALLDLKNNLWEL